MDTGAVFDVSASRDIPALPAAVWEVLRDTQHYAEWVAGTDAVTRTDGPADLAVTYAEINPIIGPWKATTRWDITECDEGRRMVHSCADLPLTRDFRVTMEMEASRDRHPRHDHHAGRRVARPDRLVVRQGDGAMGWPGQPDVPREAGEPIEHYCDLRVDHSAGLSAGVRARKRSC